MPRLFLDPMRSKSIFRRVRFNSKWYWKFQKCPNRENRSWAIFNWNRPVERLTLIASDPRISAALVILSATKMILIYFNYRIWSVQLKVIYGNVLDTLTFDRIGKHRLIIQIINWFRFCFPDRNHNVFDMHRLLRFLGMFEFM